MVSMKILVTVAAVAVVVLVAGFVPCNASTTVDEPAKYNHPTTAPPPPPPAAYPSPPPVRPVIVVEGVIYCKSCKFRGYNYSRNMDASPLPKATASLVCYGGEASKYRVLNLTSTSTDKNGYFMVMVYDVDMFADGHSCRVYLRSSPTPLCAAPFVPSNARLGLTLVKEPGRAPLPKGAKGAYHPKTALMYAPGAGGKCPPY